MSPRGHLRGLEGPAEAGDDPVRCDEYGYGLGRPDGIFVLKYRSSAGLSFGESRQDFLHQLYWSPDGLLATVHGSAVGFTGPREAFWAQRAMRHEVRASDRQTVYRVCLREIPAALADLRAGPVTIDAEAAGLIATIGGPGCDLTTALAARGRIMTGLRPAPAVPPAGAGTGSPAGPGYAMTVARALSRDPADATRLDEWAERLLISPKTLQRDFVREFGVPYTRYRTLLRLSAARVLLGTLPVTKVAHRVGYASPSAFISAYAKQYGHTPGTRPTAPPR
ncbi:helix-turn-helix transcriptional regulator [Actinomadura sp. 21ATH]|uniref:helix-turn-helix transcriptional regulator n=1 Tax=Actinomadura sp. 21ATH TaxID=1735444 RepID=UPI0035C15D66